MKIGLEMLLNLKYYLTVFSLLPTFRKVEKSFALATGKKTDLSVLFTFSGFRLPASGFRLG